MPGFFKRLVPLLALAGACFAIHGQASAAASAPVVTKKAIIDFGVCAKPVYPAASIQAKETGAVTLSFDVASTGKVQGSSVVKSSGHPALDEAARSAIGKCVFKPALANSKPVDSSVQVQYVWSLE